MLPDQKTIIEYDGIQHFEYNDFFHTNNEIFLLRRQVDIDKHILALKNNYRIIRIDYNVPTEHIKNHIMEGLNSKEPSYYSDLDLYKWIIDAVNEFNMENKRPLIYKKDGKFIMRIKK